MAASQVVLYFDKQEDALLFTLAASSVIGADKSVAHHRGNNQQKTPGKQPEGAAHRRQPAAGPHPADESSILSVSTKFACVAEID